jgi:hypothetical protein
VFPRHFGGLDNGTNKTYDTGSNQLTVRDPNNVGADMAYDSLVKKTKRTDTSGEIAKTELDKGAVFFGYTPTSQLALLNDAENQTTVYRKCPEGVRWCTCGFQCLCFFFYSQTRWLLEISIAKIHYRMAKCKQLDEATDVRVFLLSFDKQLSEAKGIALNEAEAREYIQLPGGNFAKVLSYKDFTPVEVPALFNSLRTSLNTESPSPGAMCHFPTHCLSIMRRDKQHPSKDKHLLTISISVHCENFVFPFGLEIGNQAISTKGVLQTEVLRLIEYPQSEQLRFEREKDGRSLKRD